MNRVYSLNVKLKTGVEFALKLSGENLDEVCAWLDGLDSVAEHDIVGAVAQSRTNQRSALAAARIEKGWTQQELADAIGVAQQHIQRWEAGVYKPKADTLRRIGEALGVEWSSLVD